MTVHKTNPHFPQWVCVLAIGILGTQPKGVEVGEVLQGYEEAFDLSSSGQTLGRVPWKENAAEVVTVQSTVWLIRKDSPQV